MKLFIGGTAAFWIVLFFFAMTACKRNAGDSVIYASLVCWIGGLAAWGLM